MPSVLLLKSLVLLLSFVSFSSSASALVRPLPSSSSRSPLIVTRGGSGTSMPPTTPTTPSSSPRSPLFSTAVPLSSTPPYTGGLRGSATEVILPNGRALRFGWTPRTWRSVVLVWTNAVLLTLARRKFLPFPRKWHIKGLDAAHPVAGLAVSVVMYLLEAYVYLIPLRQLQLQCFHRPKLVPAETLQLPASRFVPVSSSSSSSSSSSPLKLHALVHEHGQDKQGSSYLLHFNHGFGASSLSFEPVLESISAALGRDAPTLAAAHDAPGFGLTQEPAWGEDGLYSFDNNAELGRLLLQELEEEKRKGKMGGRVATEETQQQHVFIGHSMGSLTSAYMALNKLKEQEAASTTHQVTPVTLILVAPAIVPMREDPSHLPPASRRFLGTFSQCLARFFWQGLGLHRVTLKATSLFLRSLCYSDKFWMNGLSLAWGQPPPSPLTLAHYRLPSLKQGWDRSLSRFVLAPLMGKGGGGGGGKVDVVRELAKRLETGQLRLLILHGKKDRVIPVGSSYRLARAMPGCVVEEVDGVGHVYHEEVPQAFVERIVGFVRGGGGGGGGECIG